MNAFASGSRRLFYSRPNSCIDFQENGAGKV